MAQSQPHTGAGAGAGAGPAATPHDGIDTVPSIRADGAGMEQLLPGGYRVEGTRVVAPDGTVYGNIWAGGNHDGPGADADVDGDTSTTTSSEYDDDDADAPVIN